MANSDLSLTRKQRNALVDARVNETTPTMTAGYLEEVIEGSDVMKVSLLPSEGYHVTALVAPLEPCQGGTVAVRIQVLDASDSGAGIEGGITFDIEAGNGVSSSVLSAMDIECLTDEDISEGEQVERLSKAISWARAAADSVIQLISAHVPADEVCHCGSVVTFGFDGDPDHHRGMCEECDTVRCDVTPSACGK